MNAAEHDRAVEAAERALLNSRVASQAEIENWQWAGAKGPMPGTSSLRLAELQENLMRAKYARRQGK